MSREYVVRVVLPDGVNELSAELREFVEQLRYAGLAVVHRTDENDFCFDLRTRGELSESYVWAQMNADRMRSFGYNAVRAPAWLRGESSPAETDDPRRKLAIVAQALEVVLQKMPFGANWDAEGRNPEWLRNARYALAMAKE